LKFSNIFTKVTFYLSLFLLVLTACTVEKQGNPKFDQYREYPEMVIRGNKLQYVKKTTQEFKLLHSDLVIEPIWLNHTLNGQVTIKLTPYALPQDSIILDALGMEIHSVREIGEIEGLQTQFKYDGIHLIIFPHKTLFPNKDTEYFYISYTARPLYEDSLTKRAPRQEQGVYFNNANGKNPFVPQQCFTQGESIFARRWFPTMDETNQKMTQTMTLIVDSQFTTFSNGMLLKSTISGTKRNDYWVMNQPIAPYLSTFAVGKYDILKGRSFIDQKGKQIPITYYIEKGKIENGKTSYKNTPKMVDFFSKTFGFDYPFDCYKQITVRNFLAGAMENSTATIHSDYVCHDAKAGNDFLNTDAFIGHELAHQWFGDLVTPKNWANLTLNESFASFSELIFAQQFQGNEEARNQRYNNLNRYLGETFYKKEPIVNYQYDRPDELFDGHRYQKGSLVLWMLKNQLGDSIFFKGIQKYLTDNQYGVVEINHLRLALEKVSGKDLQPFFDNWFMKKGHPDFKINEQYNQGAKTLKLFVKQIQNDSNASYTGNIKIKIVQIINNNPEIKYYNFNLRTKKDTFTFQNIIPEYFWVFDPDIEVLKSKEEFKPFRIWEKQILYSDYKIDVEKVMYSQLLENEKSGRIQFTLSKPALKIPLDTQLLIIKQLLKYDYTNFYAYLDVFEQDNKVNFKKLIHTDLLNKIDNKNIPGGIRANYLQIFLKEPSDSANILAFKYVNDSNSYLVQNTALNYILNKEKTNISKDSQYIISNQFRESTNKEAIGHLIKFYSTKNDFTHLDFIRKKIPLLSEWSRSSALASYVHLLLKFDTKVISGDLEQLQDLAYYFNEQSMNYMLEKTLKDIRTEIEKREDFEKNPNDKTLSLSLIDQMLKLR